MGVLGSRGITPLSASVVQCVYTYWDLDMFPWTFPSDIFPGNH